MHTRFSLLPAPYTRAGRALSDLRRLACAGGAILHLAAATLLLWSAYGLGGIAALAALVTLLAFGVAFLALCAALALVIWGVFTVSEKLRAVARGLASWAGI